MIRRTSPLLKKENKVTKGGIVKEGVWDSFQVLIKFEYIFPPILWLNIYAGWVELQSLTIPSAVFCHVQVRRSAPHWDNGLWLGPSDRLLSEPARLRFQCT